MQARLEREAGERFTVFVGQRVEHDRTEFAALQDEIAAGIEHRTRISFARHDKHRHRYAIHLQQQAKATAGGFVAAPATPRRVPAPTATTAAPGD